MKHNKQQRDTITNNHNHNVTKTNKNVWWMSKVYCRGAKDILKETARPWDNDLWTGEHKEMRSRARSTTYRYTTNNVLCNNTIVWGSPLPCIVNVRVYRDILRFWCLLWLTLFSCLVAYQSVPLSLSGGNRVLTIYQVLLGWTTCKYSYETDELPNPRPTQPKKG